MSELLFGPGKWEADEIRPGDKSVWVYGPGTVRFEVDLDDVGPDAEEAVPRIVERLNASPPYPPNEAAIARLRAEVDRLTRERDEVQRGGGDAMARWMAAAAERDALAARLGEAEGLLRALADSRILGPCAFCGYWKLSAEAPRGHGPDCPLAAFLAAGERDKGKEGV